VHRNHRDSLGTQIIALPKGDPLSLPIQSSWKAFNQPFSEIGKDFRPLNMKPLPLPTTHLLFSERTALPLTQWVSDRSSPASESAVAPVQPSVRPFSSLEEPPVIVNLSAPFTSDEEADRAALLAAIQLSMEHQLGSLPDGPT